MSSMAQQVIVAQNMLVSTPNQPVAVSHNISNSNVSDARQVTLTSSNQAFTLTPLESTEMPRKKAKLDHNSRQSGVHKQVRTAMKKTVGSPASRPCPVSDASVTSGEVFVPPPVSPMKFSGVLKKSGTQRRYTNVKFLRGSREIQFRRASPAVLASPNSVQFPALSIRPAIQAPTPQALPIHVVTSQPHQVTSLQTQQGMPPIQISIPAYTAGSVTNQGGVVDIVKLSRTEDGLLSYTGGNQFITAVASSASSTGQLLQPSSFTNSFQSTGNPGLKMVSAAGLPGIPQGYTVQYVSGYGDVQANQGLVTSYPQPNQIVLQQPLMQQHMIRQIAGGQVLQPSLVQQPTVIHQSLAPVMVPHVVNANQLSYTINSPKTLVLNQQLVPSMQVIQSADSINNTPMPSFHYATAVASGSAQVQTLQQPQTLQPPHATQHLLQPMVHNRLRTQHMQNQIHIPQVQFQSPLTRPVVPFLKNNSNLQRPPQKMHRVQLQAQQQQVPPQVRPTLVSMYQDRPQASVFPLTPPKPAISQILPVKASGTTDSSLVPSSRSILPFSVASSGVVRTVATVAPAVITTTTHCTVSTVNSAMPGMNPLPPCDDRGNVDLDEDLDYDKTGDGGDRPRPTYSYRDAMNRPHVNGKKKTKHEIVLRELQPQQLPPKVVTIEQELKQKVDDREIPKNIDVENEVIVETEPPVITQTYKLVMKRDSSEQCGFNMLPLEGGNTELIDHEVKELRIKAKVSLGPKRKRNIAQPTKDKELIMAPKDVTHDGLVNEQTANMTPPSQNQINLPEDPHLFDKPTSNKCSSEPYIVFELTSEDGFKVESRHMSEVWQTVFDAVTAARASLKLCQGRDARAGVSLGSSSMSGLHMLGLTHNAVQYLLEQLPGSNDCQKYSFQVSFQVKLMNVLYISKLFSCFTWLISFTKHLWNIFYYM